MVVAVKLEAEDAAYPSALRARRGNWARLIRKTWLDDPERCPKCGTTMKLLATISSPDQDDVIRGILQARGEWDPPWESRGPPKKNYPHSDPPERVIEYELDPEQIWPED